MKANHRLFMNSISNVVCIHIYSICGSVYWLNIVSTVFDFITLFIKSCSHTIHIPYDWYRFNRSYTYTYGYIGFSHVNKSKGISNSAVFVSYFFHMSNNLYLIRSNIIIVDWLIHIRISHNEAVRKKNLWQTLSEMNYV